MTRIGSALVAMALPMALMAATPLGADVIYLKGGSRIDVEAWREAGDEVEFSAGGGIMRIPKAEVERIEGKATRGDLPMYSARPRLDDVAAAQQMSDLIRRATDLTSSPGSAPEKAGSARRIRNQWQSFEVSPALGEAHTRGARALLLLEDALAAAVSQTEADLRSGPIGEAIRELDAIYRIISVRLRP